MAGRKPGKYKQTVRCLRMLDRLRSVRYGVDLHELAREFDVTPRQVHRDLDALEQAGYATERVSGEGEGVRVQLADRPLRGVQMSVGERYAMLAARRVFDVLDGTPLHESVLSLYRRIASTLAPEQQAELEAFGERFVYLADGGTKPYGKKAELLNQLMTAVLRRWRVDFAYVRADGKKRTGVLEPFAMVLYRQGLYVLGRPAPGGDDSGNGAVRIYAAERFTRAKYRRNEGFEAPSDFKVDRFFHGVFGIFVGGTPTRVVVEFSAAMRDAIEARRWHPEQKVTRGTNGKVRVSFTVPNTVQVVPWVLSWGDHARVVEPEALAVQVQGIIKRMAKGGERAGHLSQPPPPLAI